MVNLLIKCFTESPFLKSFCILTSLNVEIQDGRPLPFPLFSYLSHPIHCSCWDLHQKLGSNNKNEFFVCNSASNMGYIAQNRKKMELVNGGHHEFWYLDLSKYTNDARIGLSIPHSVGKVIVWLVKIQKRCQKWILHAKISRKSGITQLSISICFQVTFPKFQIPPPFSRGSSKSSNQVSNLTMLSVVTGPQIAPN